MRTHEDKHAFPNSEYLERGATLRDYFAAKAMQGDWAVQDEANGFFENNVEDRVLDNRARLYYRMADAMMKAGECDE